MKLIKMKQYRKQFNYTQDQIARYLFVEQPCYCKYEKGLLPIPIDVLIKLASLYGITVNDFIDESILNKGYENLTH